MATVLIVEDDGYKSDDIATLIKLAEPSAILEFATSVAGAINAIRNGKFELIILDMALPSHPVLPGGGAPLSLLTGGIEVLFELESLRSDHRCVVITQYPDIEICGDLYPVSEAAAAMQDKYDITVNACLEYSQSNLSWRETLTTIIKILCES